MTLKDAYYIIAQGVEAMTRAGVPPGLFVIAPFGPECDRSQAPSRRGRAIRACAELDGVDFIRTRDTGAFRTSPVKANAPVPSSAA